MKLKRNLPWSSLKSALIGLTILGFAEPAGAALGPGDNEFASGMESALPAGPAHSLTRDLLRDPVEKEFELAFSEGMTNSISRRLESGTAECGGLPAEYRADCMAQTYRGAASLATRPDYTTARTQLSRTSRSLSGLVSQNVDNTAQPIRKGGKTYRAIKKSAVRAVNSRAAAIISEAETKLLRSASSGHRKVHYQRIAQAVGSTKRIFRS